LVSNLPQLQAAGHVDAEDRPQVVPHVNAEGRLLKPVVVLRLPDMPAPRLGAPEPLVRLWLRCHRC
jgi:hypothetical protein